MSTLRRDPLTHGWVIFDEARYAKPPQSPEPVRPLTTERCAFCPGNERMTTEDLLTVRRSNDESRGASNWTVRAIPNQFALLRVDGKVERRGEGPYDRMNGIGAHEVVVESPEHGLNFEDYGPTHLRDVLWVYRERSRELLKDNRFRYTQIFRNYDEASTGTGAHPHSQLIALPVLPRVVREELAHSHDYWLVKERCIFCDMLAADRPGGRLVYENSGFSTVEPFASKFPFETWIYPREHQSQFHRIPDDHLPLLAEIMLITIRAFRRATPNTPFHIIFHSAPENPEKMYHSRQAPVQEHYHWHIEIVPRGTRIAGFEYGTGTFINSVLPEDAAQYLRTVLHEQGVH